MKAGTFAQNNDSAVQPANKYDALRPNHKLAILFGCWRVRSDPHVRSSGCAAHRMVPWLWCLRIFLIQRYDLS